MYLIMRYDQLKDKTLENMCMFEHEMATSKKIKELKQVLVYYFFLFL